MPVCRHRVNGKEVWRVRLSKRPERHMYFNISLPKETVDKYSQLARRYIKGDVSADEIRKYPDLYIKMCKYGYIGGSELLTIAEAANLLQISYEYLACLSLGAQYPVDVVMANGRRYFDRSKLIAWAMNFKEKASRNKEAWQIIPLLFSQEFQSE